MPEHPRQDYKPPYDDAPSGQPTPDSLSPLRIILDAMHQRYLSNDIAGAVALARIAAPYIHPRAAPAKPATNIAQMSDEDLDALIARR